LKKAEEVMEILEAYDLTGSLRAAAALCGCDHKTVGHWVRAREEAGGEPSPAGRSRPVTGGFVEKVEWLVEHSHGKIRADKAHERLLALGYQGSERSTRRRVAEAKHRYRQRHGRRTRPWTPEPGLWLQWDYGDGPVIGGRCTVLFCAWLSWSRFRVVLPLWDKTLPSVVMALDRTLRRVGGAPTYALTDNEKTVSVDHVCGIAVRNRQIVAVARHYGFTVATCVPSDPQSKGGSEATVKIAKADIVPTDHNLRGRYRDFGELERACEAFCEKVNTREHRVTRRAPALMLAEEREHLHPLPEIPHTVCFGETRRVSWQSTISVAGAIYSVPHQLAAERVWARTQGEELVVVHAEGANGPREVARHALSTPGKPSVKDEHYPPRPPGALNRKPRARTAEEAAFLALGKGAEAWLITAGGQGVSQIRRKMAEAVDLAKLHDPERVEQALAACSRAHRFEEGDLIAVLTHQAGQEGDGARVIPFPATAAAVEEHTLQRSTRSWEGFGR
jgi:transposase